MQSQNDMFATQDIRKKVKYGFIVLCEHDFHIGSPFTSYPRSMFSNTEIPDKWLESILDQYSRLKILNSLERQIPGKNLSLFGKIEEGISENHFYFENVTFFPVTLP